MTIPDAAIEAAAAEICDWDNQYSWKSLGAESPMKASYEDAAERALSAAAQFMEAQAKAEALREAADDIERETPTARYWAGGYLRARANNLEGKSE